jgi:thioredoxin 1
MKKVLGLIFMIFLFLGCDNKDIATQIKDLGQEENSFTQTQSKIGKEAMVLEIGASSCQSCIDMKELISNLKKDNQNLPIYIVDVYDDKNSFSYFKIQMIPTQIVFNKQGEEVFRHVGKLNREKLLSLVEMAKSK